VKRNRERREEGREGGGKERIKCEEVRGKAINPHPRMTSALKCHYFTRPI